MQKNTASPTLAAQLLDALPQTQCTRCGYADCEGYAMAIASAEAAINLCPPGGQEGIERLAELTGRPPMALNILHGQETPRLRMWIDEDWCIGCTLCLKACPVDAIVGSNKRMHTIIEDDCTGCELCLPACPVDCIQTEVATPGRQAWQAWSPTQALAARQRYSVHQQRLGQTTPGQMAARHEAGAHTPPLRVAPQAAQTPLVTNEQPATSPPSTAPIWPYRPQQATPLAVAQPASSDDTHKRAAIAAALAKARASRRA